jgi:hypothetical protein
MSGANPASTPTHESSPRPHSRCFAATFADASLETSMKDNRIEKFTTHWQRTFENEPYYDKRYTWEDYDPAYRYAYKSREENPDQSFEDLEDRLEAGWDIAKGKSKLAWLDAKQAVRSAWNSLTDR